MPHTTLDDQRPAQSASAASLDKRLCSLPVFAAATDLRPVPFLTQTFPLAKNYMASFPQHAMLAGNEKRSEYFLLSPTCCYPVFAHLSGHALADHSLFANKAYCFRSEAYYQANERQMMFLMREFIYFHSRLESVNAWAQSVSQEVSALLEEMGVCASLVPATDPFFNPADFKMKFQEEQRLKHEFVVDGLAVASVNLHMASFCKACKITSSDGGPLYSACFGLGFDRLLGRLGKRLDG